MIGVGYFGGVKHTSIISPNPNEPVVSLDRSPKSVMTVKEVRSQRTELDGDLITISGAMYAAPGKLYYLIPDDEESMHPQKLPPENTVDYSIHMPDWRFRDIEVGSIYLGIEVTGRFAVLNGADFDLIAPIETLTWNGKYNRNQKANKAEMATPRKQPD